MQDVVFILLAAAVAVSIAILSLLPGDTGAMRLLPQRSHRLGHFSAYAVFAFVCVPALASLLANPLPRAVSGFLIASAFGMTMEFLQRYRPGRAPSRRDALVDVAGAALGALAALGWNIAGF